MRAGPLRLAMAGAILAAVVVALGAIVMRVGEPSKSLLYSGLSLTEAGEIAQRLDQAGVKYELRGDGGVIFVERSKLLQTRLLLAGEGLPTRGSIGYELFDRQETLGQTSFVQNLNRVRALEGELARTIATINGVDQARVHLVLPERRLFERDGAQPTASIVLTLAGDGATAQAAAIRHLVASAVPGLAPERVTIADQRGRLLASGADGGENAALQEGAEDRRAKLEDRLREQLTALVEQVSGAGAARVDVAADLDFNRVQEKSVIYDPDGRVVRSQQTVEDTNTRQDTEQPQGVTVGANVPDAAPAQGGVTTNSTDQGERVEETINYEISTTNRTEVFESGRIRRLSVAVAIDNIARTAEDGTVTYEPRTAEELQRIEALVRTAMGFDAERGDVLQVVNINFARPETGEGASAAAPSLLETLDIARLAEVGALLIGALALIFFVLRPVMVGGGKKGKGGKGGGFIAGSSGDDMMKGPIALTDSSGAVALGGGAAAAALGAPTDGLAADIEERMAVARIQGEVKVSSLKKVANLIEAHPEESVAIIRGWLNESRGAA